MKRLALPTIFLAFSALLASGCVYKMNIQQGNYLVPDSVSQLKEGMTRSQVRFLLGTPMVPDAFDDSRWDYYYFFSSQKFKEPLKRRLTVFFADDKVARYENQGVPTQADLEQLERDLRKAVAETRTRTRRSPVTKRQRPPSRLAARRLLRKPRRLPIRCRLPRPCPLPPGLLRVQPERPVELDPVAVARHRAAIAQLAEDPDVRVPGHVDCPRTARAPRPAHRPRSRRRAAAPATATAARASRMPRCSSSSS